MKKIEEIIRAIGDWVQGFVSKNIRDFEEKLDPDTILRITGDASEVTNKFSKYSPRTLPVSGEELQTTLGKILGYLSDLRKVAFSGNYEDLINKAISKRITYAYPGITNAYTKGFLYGEAEGATKVWLVIGYGSSVSAAGVTGATDFARAYLVIPKMEASNATSKKGRSFLLAMLGSIGSAARYTIAAVAATDTDTEYIKLTIPKGSYALVTVWELQLEPNA